MQLNPLALLRGRRDEQRNAATDALMQAFSMGAAASASGVRVTPETALASVAVAACIEVRAETFSALPGGVFQKQDRTRNPLPLHDVNRLLFDRPNDLMTSGELLRWKQMRQDITGNAYIRIIWRKGRPAELWPMYGEAMEVKTANGKIAYRYGGDPITPAGNYLANEVLHFRGPFLKTPLVAESPIKMIADTIGLSIASEQFFGRFLNNGSHFPTFLETEQVLSDEDVVAVQKSLAKQAGVLNAGKTKIFDRGLKLKQNQMSLRDADLSAQMRWYLEQICRIYRVPLPLVQDWTHGTYTNSEQAGLWFAQHTIAPICVDTERTIRKLFVPGEEDHYAKWNIDGLLRGDYATRTAGYQSAISAGWMNRNEARAYEDMDPFDGGDEYLVPLNMAAAPAALEAGDGETPPADPLPQDPAEPRTYLQPLLDDALDRIRIRAAQDKERGREPQITVDFAHEHVLPPICRAFDGAGIELDVDALLSELGIGA